MSFTVIGMFDHKQNAEKAEQQLFSSGFHRDYVDSSPFNNGDVNNTSTNIYDYQEDEKTTSFWDWLFGEDETARAKYSAVGSRTHILSVQCDDRTQAEKAAEIMDNCGAVDVDEYASKYHNSTTNYAADNTFEAGETKVNVVKEQMNVGKRTVETGGAVRLKSRIIEKPVEETLRLREERVYVKRNNVNRPATSADLNPDTETVSYTAQAEVPVVEKEARVVEEITVGKDVDVNTEVIADTVRETEVEVEHENEKTVEYESSNV